MKSLQEQFTPSCSPEEFSHIYLGYLTSCIDALDCNAIGRFIELIVQACESENIVYFIGNGGSATTASHFAADVMMNTSSEGNNPIRAISLVDNMAIVTAQANDYGFDNVFLSQLKCLLRPDDVVVSLSVSGKSENILRALRYAREVGATTVGCVGFDGGTLKDIVDLAIHIPTEVGEYGPVEDIFQILDHLVYTYLRLRRTEKL